MKIIIIITCIIVGYLCSQIGNSINNASIQYGQNKSQIERIANILEDWKQLDTQK